MHSYDSLLNSLHKDFNAYHTCTSALDEEDSVYCVPRFARGSGGVAIMWWKSIDRLIIKLPQFSNDRIVSIKVTTSNRPICFFAVYLPTRSGGTDSFKASLDYLDASLQLLSNESDVVILGDLNADPGPSGGPLASSPNNERGRILSRYLTRWNFISCHLNPPSCSRSSRPSHTYVSEAHQTFSTIDHILCPKHFHKRISDCVVLDDNPLNLSDHLPVIANMTCTLQCTSQPEKHVAPHKRHKPNWRKVDKDEMLSTYTQAVEDALAHIPLPVEASLLTNTLLIDSHLELIVHVLLEAGANFIPGKSYAHYRRPGWNPSPSDAHKSPS